MSTELWSTFLKTCLQSCLAASHVLSHPQLFLEQLLLIIHLCWIFLAAVAKVKIPFFYPLLLLLLFLARALNHSLLLLHARCPIPPLLQELASYVLLQLLTATTTTTTLSIVYSFCTTHQSTVQKSCMVAIACHSLTGREGGRRVELVVVEVVHSSS